MQKQLHTIILFSITLIGFGQATFLSNFEDQNTDPGIGSSVLVKTGTSGGMYVVPNPHPDARNSSDYVLKQCTEPGTGGKAEYTTGRYETNEKKYIYTWKRFHPTGMFTDIEISGWVALNQWKSWLVARFYLVSGESATPLASILKLLAGKKILITH